MHVGTSMKGTFMKGTWSFINCVMKSGAWRFHNVRFVLCFFCCGSSQVFPFSTSNHTIAIAWRMHEHVENSISGADNTHLSNRIVPSLWPFPMPATCTWKGSKCQPGSGSTGDITNVGGRKCGTTAGDAPAKETQLVLPMSVSVKFGLFLLWFQFLIHERRRNETYQPSTHSLFCSLLLYLGAQDGPWFVMSC